MAASPSLPPGTDTASAALSSHDLTLILNHHPSLEMRVQAGERLVSSCVQAGDVSYLAMMKDDEKLPPKVRETASRVIPDAVRHIVDKQMNYGKIFDLLKQPYFPEDLRDHAKQRAVHAASSCLEHFASGGNYRMVQQIAGDDRLPSEVRATAQARYHESIQAARASYASRNDYCALSQIALDDTVPGFLRIEAMKDSITSFISSRYRQGIDTYFQFLLAIASGQQEQADETNKSINDQLKALVDENLPRIVHTITSEIESAHDIFTRALHHQNIFTWALRKKNISLATKCAVWREITSQPLNLEKVAYLKKVSSNSGIPLKIREDAGQKAVQFYMTNIDNRASGGLLFEMANHYYPSSVQKLVSEGLTRVATTLATRL
ncbi:hypothetical protein HYU19_05125 [Candidatus Woesearchaeota archaeon]|nr:hypothetical protein [Candidatus Woesearchaeota archaeon]